MREDSHRLRFLFLKETIRTNKPCLVEKLPINNFRLFFIHAILPDARFIHIFRCGIEVVRSIGKRGLGWFGYIDYKWNLLVDYAYRQSDTAVIVELCQTIYERGLLEWQLSIEAIYPFAKTISKESFLEISYDNLVDTPIETLRRVLNFINLDESNEVKSFVMDNTKRRSEKITTSKYSDKEKATGGRFLQTKCNEAKGEAKKKTVSK